MPVDVRRAKNNANAIESAIAAFEANVTHSSIDDVEITHEQRTGGRVTIAIVYSTA